MFKQRFRVRYDCWRLAVQKDPSGEFTLPCIETFLLGQKGHRYHVCMHHTRRCRRPRRCLAYQHSSIGRTHVDRCRDLAPTHTELSPTLLVCVHAPHFCKLLARPLGRSRKIRRACQSRPNIVKQGACIVHDPRMLQPLGTNARIHAQVEPLACRLYCVLRCLPGSIGSNSSSGRHEENEDKNDVTSLEQSIHLLSMPPAGILRLESVDMTAPRSRRPSRDGRGRRAS